MEQLVLWDIDGTLILGGNLGARALGDYFKRTYGWQGVREALSPHGRMDPGIVDGIFAHFGHVPSVGEREEVLSEYLLGLAEVIGEADNGSRCLPGVPEVLSAADAHGSWQHGLLTGNLQEAARLKLSYHGLWERFSFGAFGEDGVNRCDLIPVAWERARAATGVCFDRETTWIVGDTPADAAAARAHRVRVALVATNPGVPFEDLLGCEPDVLLKDLSDVGAFWEALGGASVETGPCLSGDQAGGPRSV